MYEKGGMCCPVRNRRNYIKNLKRPAAHAAGRFWQIAHNGLYVHR